MKDYREIDAALDGMVGDVLARCMSWVGEDACGNTVLVDPHDGEAVGHHYSLSHFGAALVLGWPEGSPEFELGVRVLEGVLERWPADSATPGFHGDFNNFALCLAWLGLNGAGSCVGLRERIARTVGEAPDSAHDTVNWLPMRMVAANMRSRWYGDGRGDAVLTRCRGLVAAAANPDGLVEDRLPRGVSFNLQYDISTVAGLDVAARMGVVQPLDLDRCLAALLGALLPDGDPNYLGRGCNQIFAWGPWLYLLKARGPQWAWELSSGYLARRLPAMLANENLLLNDLSGAERGLWWDYHHCSVYTAHLLLWLVLARRLRMPECSEACAPLPLDGSGSGVAVRGGEGWRVVTFSGRGEYLAERGPSVCAVWTERLGALHKGAFGPWLRPFGLAHSSPAVAQNWFGLLGVDGWGGGGLREGLGALKGLLRGGDPFSGTRVRPLFAPVSAAEEDGRLAVTYAPGRSLHACVNLPLLDGAAAAQIEVFADGAPVPLREAGSIVTQYGREALFQSGIAKAREWKVRVGI